jgi:hypothetical protein
MFSITSAITLLPPVEYYTLETEFKTGTPVEFTKSEPQFPVVAL